MDAANFQVNGTILFHTDQDAQALADEVVRLLTPVCGYDDMAIVRPVRWILDLELGEIPSNAEVSLFDGPDRFPEALPWDAPAAGLTVVRADALHAVSINDLERTSGATWTLERLLGVPVTSRGVPTMTRLQTRLRALADD